MDRSVAPLCWCWGISIPQHWGVSLFFSCFLFLSCFLPWHNMQNWEEFRKQILPEEQSLGCRISLVPLALVAFAHSSSGAVTGPGGNKLSGEHFSMPEYCFKHFCMYVTVICFARGVSIHPAIFFSFGIVKAWGFQNWEGKKKTNKPKHGHVYMKEAFSSLVLVYMGRLVRGKLGCELTAR